MDRWNGSERNCLFSEFQNTDMASLAVLDDGIISSRKYQPFCARRCDQKPVSRVSVGLSGQKGAFCGYIFV
jgi:hypothetical protein